jgi:adenylate cyclase
MPIDVRAIHATDLDGWAEDSASPPFQDLLRSLTAMISRPASSGSAAVEPTAADAPAAKPAGVAICVLPFANMSGDAEQEYFSDGISEDVITDLSKVSALSIIARNTAFTFKGKHVGIPPLARQLKVTRVFEKDTAETVNWAKVDPDLDAIRELPRFKAMLAKADARLSAQQ